MHLGVLEDLVEDGLDDGFQKWFPPAFVEVWNTKRVCAFAPGVDLKVTFLAMTVGRFSLCRVVACRNTPIEKNIRKKYS